MTEKQAQAIREHAAKMRIRIGKRFSWDNKKWLDSEVITASEWIIIEKASGYNYAANKQYEPPKQEPQATPELSDDDILEAPTRAKGKKK